MLEKFKNHLETNFSFLEGKGLFLAVSGGLDSMVLLHLFQQLSYQFEILHCNFYLRKQESQADQQFVQDYGEKHNITCCIGHFQAKEYAESNKISTQIAARNLRYNWFQEQLTEKKFDYLLTAHHLDDCLETFLINLSRGTGLDGLTGIPEINNNIIRPLLIFSRDEIKNYALKNNVFWREDSSNETDDYLRNKIRHHAVPQLKNVNENFLENFKKTQTYLKKAQSLIEDASFLVKNRVVKYKENDLFFNIETLLTFDNHKQYLYLWLKEYHFKSWDDIYALLYAENGKMVSTKEYHLLKYRNELILSKKKNRSSLETFLITESDKKVNFPIKLSICNITDISAYTKKCIFVDEKKLEFPLVIRRCKEDDVFLPFGMEGKSKKVTKFLKAQKLSRFDKEKVWLLCSGNQVVWIVGFRQDERQKITENTKKILKIELI